MPLPVQANRSGPDPDDHETRRGLLLTEIVEQLLRDTTGRIDLITVLNAVREHADHHPFAPPETVAADVRLLLEGASGDQRAW